jgi:hypothetical protein
MLLFSLRFGFTQNLTNHILNTPSLTPLQFTQKPLVKLSVNALLENRQAFNTHNYVKPEK